VASAGPCIGNNTRPLQAEARGCRQNFEVPVRGVTPLVSCPVETDATGITLGTSACTRAWSSGCCPSMRTDPQCRLWRGPSPQGVPRRIRVSSYEWDRHPSSGASGMERSRFFPLQAPAVGCRPAHPLSNTSHGTHYCDFDHSTQSSVPWLADTQRIRRVYANAGGEELEPLPGATGSERCKPENSEPPPQQHRVCPWWYVCQ
jgi:hypothetical protein